MVYSSTGIHHLNPQLSFKNLYSFYIIKDDGITNQILGKYIDILDSETRRYYEMLMILQSDDMLTVEMLSIYWNVNINKALQITGKLCDNHFIYKKWMPEHNFNMYGIYNLHLEYLQCHNTKDQLKVNISLSN